MENMVSSVSVENGHSPSGHDEKKPQRTTKERRRGKRESRYTKRHGELSHVAKEFQPTCSKKEAGEGSRKSGSYVEPGLADVAQSSSRTSRHQDHNPTRARPRVHPNEKNSEKVQRRPFSGRRAKSSNAQDRQVTWSSIKEGVDSRQRAMMVSNVVSSHRDTEDTDHGKAEEKPMCLLCCDAMHVVALGKCNHQACCAKCCLRLRMCYKKKECPVCKEELEEIVLATWRPAMPDFEFFTSSENSRVMSAGAQLGQGKVWVDTWQRRSSQKGSHGGSGLLRKMVGLVTLSCSKCPVRDRKPFKSQYKLMEHMKEKHGSYLCAICLKEGRDFPLDLPVYDTEESLKAHMKERHPACQFCRKKQFYDSDELWNHLVQNHFKCQICDQDTEAFSSPWFRNAGELQLHLSRDHFACEAEGCRECLVAYRTLEELQQHHIEHHSGRMRRWDRASSRPLQLDFNFTAARLHQAPPSAVHSGAGARAFPRELDEGQEVIDDDIGMLPISSTNTGQGTNYRAVLGLQSVVAPTEDHFPSLEAARAPEQTSNQETQPQKPALVGKISRCPCGRRKTKYVLLETEEAPPLKCDHVCELENRRNQLDDAFGINRKQHLPVFERRHVEWSGALLAAAKKDPKLIQFLEAQLEEFLKSSAARKELDSMPRGKRAIIHELSEQYGFATASVGNEPNRRVQLFKPTGNAQPAGLPDKLLSVVSCNTSDEEIQELLTAAQGYPIRVTDVATTVDISYYLRQWKSMYTIEWEDSSTAIVTFQDAALVEQVTNQLGGGIRGLFRIDLKWKPKTTIASDEKTNTAPPPWSSRMAEPNLLAESSAGPSSDRLQQQQRGGSSTILPAGWALITRR